MMKGFFLLLVGMLMGIASVSAKNRALLIGIGGYDTAQTGWSVLHGDNDVALLRPQLEKEGYSVTTLVNSQATKQNVVRALTELSKSAQAGDRIYLHFSGHGQLMPDFNGDECDGFDQSFACYDSCISSEYKIGGTAYYGQHHLVDDELYPYLDMIKRKVGAKGSVTLILDACYSGDGHRGGVAETMPEESEVEWTLTVRGTDDEFPSTRQARQYLEKLKRPSRYSKGGALTIVSACERNQKNYECKAPHSGKKYGSLSYCISKFLAKDPSLSGLQQYFKGKQYISAHIFRKSQTPIVEIYR